MGGKAIKNTRRVPLIEYKEIKDTLIERLNELGYPYILDIPHVEEKRDFGDLDLLLPKPKSNELSNYLAHYLKSKEIVKNGDIVSFEFRNFQVDLIHVSEKNIKLTQTYFSYNDLGMLMGILAKRIHCKYGGDGLYYRWYSENFAKRKDILLSKDPKLIFKVLGLSFNRFKKGFSTFREMFEFVRSSPLFDTYSFISQEHWNHRRRTRNNKRKTWHDFIVYCNSSVLIENPKPYNSIDYISRFLNIDLYSEINRIEEEEQRKKIVKSKFNGNLVKSITGLQGKELGDFIKSFKNSKDNFENWVLTNSKSTLKEEIKQFNNRS